MAGQAAGNTKYCSQLEIQTPSVTIPGMNTLDTIYKTLTSASPITFPRNQVSRDGDTLRIQNQTLSIIDVAGEPNLFVQMDNTDLAWHYRINEDRTLGCDNMDPTDLFDVMGNFTDPMVVG